MSWDGKVDDNLGPNSHLPGYIPRALEVSEASPLKSDCLYPFQDVLNSFQTVTQFSDQLSNPATSNG